MADSVFRESFDYLRKLPGRHVEWPQLLRKLIEDEFVSPRQTGGEYKGEVFRNRDEHAFLHKDHADQHREDVSVQRLFRNLHESRNGELDLNGTPVWLISYEVPNQDDQRQRCADLLGVRSNGSIIVFEAKTEGNSDSPLTALLEGLDYLLHLKLESNMHKLQRGFNEWRKKKREAGKTPADFTDREIDPAGRHSVVVLGPASYYEKHRLDSEGKTQGWAYLSDRLMSGPLKSNLSLDFAVLNFDRAEPARLLNVSEFV